MTTFRPGQEVRLVSGGPILAVVSKTEEELLREAAAGAAADDDATTKCMWFADRDLKVATIPTAALIEAPPWAHRPIDSQSLTEDDLQRAVDQLRLSDRGRRTLQMLVAWLDDVGLGLDALNQQAVYALMAGAWGSFPSLARDLMRGSQ